MINLVIVRGPSGSGKSTFVDMNFMLHKHYEADQYFDLHGEYAYDPERIRDAQKWCQWRTEQSLMRGHHVAVSNTFCRLWEMAPYIEMSEKYGCLLSVYRCAARYNNTHGVPTDIVERQRQRMEDYKGEYLV